MDNTERTLLAKLEKVRENQDGTEDWKVETPFDVVNYGFIKCLEQGKKGLKFDAVKIVDGKLTLFFVRKSWGYAH